MKKNPVKLFFKLTRPILLLGGFGLSILGAGIAKYLGNPTNWEVFYFGLLWVLLTQLSGQYLDEYFDQPVDRDNQNRTLFSGGSGQLGKNEDQLDRKVALSAFVVTLTLSVAIILVMIWSGTLSWSAAILMSLILFLSLAYSIPPIQLSRSGYGEFVAAIAGGYLVPMFSYNLQTGEIHRLVAFTGLPVVLLLVVFFLAVSFPDYATDLKYAKRTFLIRAGWQNAMTVHNTLVLLAFVVLAALWFFDFPRAILLPTYMTMPLGFTQFWQMRRIGAGGKPNWKALTFNAAALVGSVVYLFSYSFWTR
ncbi:MAG: prenyltransferase [Anaerolineales bacterium]|nr:prenyltransferase [Anaerolineales bacterium]